MPTGSSQEDGEIEESKDPLEEHLFYGLKEKDAPEMKELVAKLKKLRAKRIGIKVLHYIPE